MGYVATVYGTISAMTALWLFWRVRPTTRGEMVGATLITLFWPIFMLWVAAGEREC